MSGETAQAAPGGAGAAFQRPPLPSFMQDGDSDDGDNIREKSYSVNDDAGLLNDIDDSSSAVRPAICAYSLLLIGFGLFLFGVIAEITGVESVLRGFIFIIAGVVVFIPGCYMSVYVYRASLGHHGYRLDFLDRFSSD